MLKCDELRMRVQNGLYLLDGATGTHLIEAGMPRGCCTEMWILEHEEVLTDLQRRYEQAGSQLIYAPTFRAQPLALARFGLADETERINARLVQLSRKAAPDCIVAGNLTTMAGCVDPQEPAKFDALIAGYRRQIRGIIDGGADLLAAETLLYAQEAFAILEAARAEGAGAVMCTFVIRPDGCVRSGENIAELFPALAQRGAAALGVNCVTADEALPELIGVMRAATELPLICKPNAGRAQLQGAKRFYPVNRMKFAKILMSCMEKGADLVGGCCGTSPEYIKSLADMHGK